MFFIQIQHITINLAHIISIHLDDSKFLITITTKVGVEHLEFPNRTTSIEAYKKILGSMGDYSRTFVLRTECSSFVILERDL